MEEKLNIKIVIRILAFLLIAVLLLQILNMIFLPKWTSHKENNMTHIMQGFYDEPKNSLDVIFMGNSDVYGGISPIKLWQEYGIASYNYVSAGQRMWTAYYMLEESLKYQKPKVIFLNMDSAFNESKSGESNYRKVFDNMRLGETKIKAITDPVFEFNKKTKRSYLFPILRFHSRWDALEDRDFEEMIPEKHFAHKGLDMTTVAKPYTGDNSYMKDIGKIEDLGEKCLKYVEKMVKLCKENNIELILFEVPSPDSWYNALSKGSEKFAQKHGLTFIDLNYLTKEIGIDWSKDTRDAGDHLNVYGAEKVAKYLGKYLKENYDLEDHRNDPKYEQWNIDAVQYEKDKAKLEQEGK